MSLYSSSTSPNPNEHPTDELNSAKVFLLFAGVPSAILTVSGIVGFFSAQQDAMPLIGAVTVSAIGVLLTSGVVFWMIGIAEHLAELMHSRDCEKYEQTVSRFRERPVFHLPAG